MGAGEVMQSPEDVSQWAGSSVNGRLFYRWSRRTFGRVETDIYPDDLGYGPGSGIARHVARVLHATNENRSAGESGFVPSRQSSSPRWMRPWRSSGAGTGRSASPSRTHWNRPATTARTAVLGSRETRPEEENREHQIRHKFAGPEPAPTADRDRAPPPSRSRPTRGIAKPSQN